MEHRTTREVIAALGGATAVARLGRWKGGTVWMWGARNKFPAESYIIIHDALEAKGDTAPLSLWGMKERLQAAE